MLGFAANLSLMFTEAALPERFERAARAGFRAVEIQFPYQLPAPAFRRRLDDAGLRLVLCNAPPGDLARGERGLAALPGREAEFRAGIEQAAAYARQTGAPSVHVMSGLPPADADAAQVRRTWLGNLRHAAAVLQDAGVQALVEPLNPHDVPGYFLDRVSKAAALIEEAACDNLYLQFDVYHAQRSEGELAASLDRHLARIAHVQIADTPGRHEPGSGEIHYPFLLRHLKRIGYAGWIGAEYVPAAGTEAGLGWLQWAREAIA